MSPEKFKKLEKLRKKLDKIDNSLLKIIKKRSDIVRKVLQLKSFKKEIVYKKRINRINYVFYYHQESTDLPLKARYYLWFHHPCLKHTLQL